MKTLLKTLIFGVLAIITLLVLAASWISFQGRRDFAAVRSDLLARGEKLGLSELVPPPIPDEQNFFADPMWKISADGNQIPDLSALLKQSPTADETRSLKAQFPAFASLDFSLAREAVARAAWKKAPGVEAARFLQAVLRPLAPTVAHVTELLARPGARFPTAYDKIFSSPIPHLSLLLTLGRIFQVQAQAALALGDSVTAQGDILLIFRLADAVATEPLLISLLVRVSVDGLAVPPLATGLSTHAWTDPELLALQRAIEAIDLSAGLAHALRGERGGFNDFFELLRRNDESALAGWAVTNGDYVTWIEAGPWKKALLRTETAGYLIVFGPGEQAFHNAQVAKLIAAADHAHTQGLHPDQVPSENLPEFRYPARIFHPLAATAIPAISGIFRQVAEAQDRLIQARIACALERFFLLHHEYPATLDQLVPDFLPAVPADIVTMRPMHYVRSSPDAFRLWSDGWDLKDDGGTPADRRTKLGDWVWNQPQR